jgi:hypothetical protein
MLIRRRKGKETKALAVYLNNKKTRTNTNN